MTATVLDAVGPAGDAGLYEQRWQTLWQEMEREGVTALAVYGRGSLGSYGALQYLSGCFAGPKGTFGLITVGCRPVLVAGSEIEAELLRAGARAPGVEVICGTLPGAAASTGSLLAGASGACGLAAPPGGLPAGELELLFGAAAGNEPRDLSHLLETARAAIGPEDAHLLAAAAIGAEAAIERFAAGFEVGMSEREAAAEIDAELSRRGALTRMVFVSAGSFRGRLPSDRELLRGEPITVLVEQAAPSGHWAEIGVIAVAGALDPGAAAVADACIEALRIGGDGLVPGAPTTSVAAAMEAALHERGGRPISGLGHGTGVDEKGPVIAAGAAGTVDAGTAFALHPSYAALAGADGPTATVANTFLIGAEAAAPRPLSALPYRLLELA